MKIKEKVLKEVIWSLDGGIYDNELRRLIDLTLTEVGKVIDELVTKEEKCMKEDDYTEQIIEHQSQIEMANNIKQKLGIK